MNILTLINYIFLGVAVCVAYFVIANFILDTYLSKFSNKKAMYSAVRPWIFLAPALLILITYLVYPVFETIRLSFYDNYGRDFVGLKNYYWAFTNQEFHQSIFNNLIWLLFVPIICTFFGLIIAAMADRVWWGGIAKSLIFMPMAISFVGASVIWKFVYNYNGPDNEQIGILNAAVMYFGGEPQAWIAIPFWNNFFLMFIMVWIQTGLAMVIFSAALRSISNDIIEAARIDGAGEIRIFLAIIVPMLSETILVIWTTITILVLKVFDIVLAMTNGQWDTEVLANMMFDWMFRGGGDSGRGSTIALMILLGVIPIMIWNLKRFRSENQP
tara:strand:- start:2317 stop:3300 length:984 start_codon:yes stop_codon:yes gene_type:complete